MGEEGLPDLVLRNCSVAGRLKRMSATIRVEEDLWWKATWLRRGRGGS